MNRLKFIIISIIGMVGGAIAFYLVGENETANFLVLYLFCGLGISMFIGPIIFTWPLHIIDWLRLREVTDYLMFVEHRDNETIYEDILGEKFSCTPLHNETTVEKHGAEAIHLDLFSIVAKGNGKGFEITLSSDDKKQIHTVKLNGDGARKLTRWLNKSKYS